MMPGQPIPMNGVRFLSCFSALADQLLQHLDETIDGFIAGHLLVVRVTPQLELRYRGLRKVGGAFAIEIDHAGPDVGAADIDGQDRVVTLEHP